MPTRFIHPGEIFFGTSGGTVRTILGSCVAIVLWHPERHLGGMCHFVLPSRSRNQTELDGRYAEEAFELLGQAASRWNSRLQDYQIRAYGGGNMFPGVASRQPLVGDQNAASARRLLAANGLRLHDWDLGGTYYRSVTLEPATGRVRVTRSVVANFGLKETA